MNRVLLAVLSSFGLSLLLAPALFADSGQRLIPAGSLVSCTTGGARISSQSTAVGDPVLCKVSHRRGDFMLPYGSYLGGEFSEFKDPGHLVGKGWMQLDFDRLYVDNTVIPLDAKVVDVPGYSIDREGRILGKGHPVRDTISWMIPILWPIDLINLPRRGPRPTLKAETALTLRVMEDVKVPVAPEPQRDPYGLIPRGQGSYTPEPPPARPPQPAPQMSYSPAPAYYYASPRIVAYVPVPAPVMVFPAPLMMAYGYGRLYLAPAPVMAYGPAYSAVPAYPSGYPPRGVNAPEPVYPRGAMGYRYGYGYGSRGPAVYRTAYWGP
jgi:hypothetical protein